LEAKTRRGLLQTLLKNNQNSGKCIFERETDEKTIGTLLGREIVKGFPGAYKMIPDLSSQ
jgi:hypothetical protein